MLAVLLVVAATLQLPLADTARYRVEIRSFDTTKVAFLGEPDRVGSAETTAWVKVWLPRNVSSTVMIVIDSVRDVSAGTSRGDYAADDVRAAWGARMEGALDSTGRIVPPGEKGGQNVVAASLFSAVGTALFPGFPKPLTLGAAWADVIPADSTTPLMRDTGTTEWKVVERVDDEWVIEGIMRATSSRSAPTEGMKAESQVTGRSRRTVTPTGIVTSFRGAFDLTGTIASPGLPSIPVTHNAVTVITRLR